MGVATAMVVGGVLAAGGSVASAKINSNAAGKATRAQTGATNRAMGMEERAEAARLDEARRVEAQNQRNWEIEQGREQERYQRGRDDASRLEAADSARWAWDQRRKEPNRAVGRGAVNSLASLAGIQGVPGEAPPDFSRGWDAGAMSPEQRTPGFTPPPPGERSLPGDPRIVSRQAGSIWNPNMADLGAERMGR